MAVVVPMHFLHLLFVKLLHLFDMLLAFLAGFAIADTPRLAMAVALAAISPIDNRARRTNLNLNPDRTLAVVQAVCIRLATGRYHYRQHHNHHHQNLFHNFILLWVNTFII